MAVSLDMFQVVVGSTTYRWTTGDAAVTYLSNTYPPVPGARTDIALSDELGQDGIKITLPVSHALAQLYLTATPDLDSDITLYRQDNSGTYVAWKGGVGAVTLHPGCDRTLATCKGRFANQINYGGFPWIPGQNPYGPAGAL